MRVAGRCGRLAAGWAAVWLLGSSLLAACGSDSPLRRAARLAQADEAPPASGSVEARLSVRPADGVAPLRASLVLACVDPDGGQADLGHRLDTDGDGYVEVAGEGRLELRRSYTRSVRVQGQCVSEDGSVAATAARQVRVEPNRPPVLDLDGLELTLEEDGAAAVRLADVVRDPDGNGGLDSVTVVEGPRRLTRVRLQGDTLRLAAAPDAHGSFVLAFHASDPGYRVSKRREGRVRPLTDLAPGRLVPVPRSRGEEKAGAEAGTPEAATRRGELRVYDARDTSLVVTLSTDRHGRWGRVRNLGRFPLLLQARLGTGDRAASFVRTLERPESGADLRIPRLRIVSRRGLAGGRADAEAFRRWVLEVEKVIENGFVPRVDPWRGGGPVRVYVAAEAPCTGTRFRRREQRAVASAFRAPDRVPALTGRRPEVRVGNRSDPEPPYRPRCGAGGDDGTEDARGAAHDPGASGPRPPEVEAGWLVVLPGCAAGCAGEAFAEDRDDDGLTESGGFYLRPGLSPADLRAVALHEAAHVVLGLGHARSFGPPATVMGSGGLPRRPGRGVREAGPGFLEVELGWIYRSGIVAGGEDPRHLFGRRFFQ